MSTGRHLYALPDHEVMESLLPGIDRRRIPAGEAIEQLAERRGLVPVAIHPERGGSVYFADIGDTPLLEWKYIYTIERLAAEGAIGRSFATDLSVLESDRLPDDGLAPDGLLFHVSRCGSTLFCKALARLPANLIINQGGPLQSGFWAALTDTWRHPPQPSAENLRMFVNLVRLMARRRRPEYRRCYIKFISWNVIFLDFIRAAFPDSRALYLYRDPAEVAATVLEETTAVLHARGTPLARMLTGLSPDDTRNLSDAEFLAHCYGHYFGLVAEAAGRLGLNLVNYRELRQADLFPAILERGLGWPPSVEELAVMRTQFEFYSKDDSGRTRYQGEPDRLERSLDAGSLAAIDALARPACAALDRSPRNLFPPGREDSMERPEPARFQD